ncbi:shikimate kinase [Arcanobacterium canis]|uniref:Shikimate kinase n=1 Tax=Arcanobacterium canis TaxID=999183 RepID=A0ABY8FVU7_9ACTO|nr:shikimate kinase [Arcanobacterium canis]WFM82645.1 shikimate kinase [Arcanobacterium canis]
MTIVLLGAPGSGKTSIARELQNLGYTAADTDQIVAQRFGVEPADLYLLVPREQRVQVSESVLLELLDQVDADGKFVIAASSESLQHNSAAMATLGEMSAHGGRIVWLHADLSTLVRRNGMMGQHSAAIMMPRRHLRELMETMRLLAEPVVNEVIETSDRDIAEIAASLA